MSETIVFISRHRIKEGTLEDLKQYLRDGVGSMERDKPQTLVFHAYLNGDGTEVSFVHVFADAGAMDLHLEGADERSQAAYQFIEPQGFEIYGEPSERALGMMQQAAGAGIDLRVASDPVVGFIRLASG